MKFHLEYQKLEIFYPVDPDQYLQEEKVSEKECEEFGF